MKIYITLHEIQAEPDYVIYMFACLLLDTFQKYLLVSFVLLSSTRFFLGGGEGGFSSIIFCDLGYGW